MGIAVSVPNWSTNDYNDMKKIALILVSLWLLALVCKGQTNVIYGNLGNVTLNPPSMRGSVIAKLLAPIPRTVGNTWISSFTQSASVNTTNGSFAFTNLISGYYSATATSAQGTTVHFWVYDSTVGNVPFASLISNDDTEPPNPGTNYYTQAQIDAMRLSGGAVTNLSTAHVIITSSATNIVGFTAQQVTNMPNIFGPWRGEDYAQQAVDSLPDYGSDRSRCGGGIIEIYGQNILPNGIHLTRNSINTYRFESPEVPYGCLITKTNPCILIDNGEPGIPTIYVTFKNVTISSFANLPERLYWGKNGVEETIFDHCYFGPWEYLTNAYIFSEWIGIGGSDTFPNLDSMVNNLVIDLNSLDGQRAYYLNNYFKGIAGIHANDDHAEWQNNLFGGCGNRNTGWDTNSLYWAGGCIVVDTPSNENILHHTDFYDCTAGYFQACHASGVKGTADGLRSEYDKYETDNFSVIHYGDTVFEQGNPIALNANSATAGQDGNGIAWGIITNDNAAVGVTYTTDIISMVAPTNDVNPSITHGNLFIPTNYVTPSTLAGANVKQSTNSVNATNLVGATASATLRGLTGSASLTTAGVLTVAFTNSFTNTVSVTGGGTWTPATNSVGLITWTFVPSSPTLAGVNTYTGSNTFTGTNLFITTPSSAAASSTLGLDANGRVTTNVTAASSLPTGLVTNYSGAPISVTNASGVATTISSNSIVITNGIFKTTLGTGLILNGGVLTLAQTNSNSKTWSIYTTNNNMYIDGAVGGGGQNLYFGTSGGNTIAALNFSGVGSFQSCPAITVSTYFGTDGGNDYWNKQTISTLDPLTIFGLGGNSHNVFQFPNAFGATVITNGSGTAPCVTVCGQTGGTGDLMQWWDGATKRSSISTNGIYAAVGFSSTGTHTPVAVTVGASPFNLTNNTGAALECYFSGATAYTVGKNGVTVFASMIANDYFVLQPSSYATVTYTVAPTFYTNAW